MMLASSATLEAATVIRVPPPGLEAGYAVAVVRDTDGLHTVRLLYYGDTLPSIGTRVVATESPVAGVLAFRPAGA